MVNNAEEECFYFKKKGFQTDILPPLFSIEYKETTNTN